MTTNTTHLGVGDDLAAAVVGKQGMGFPKGLSELSTSQILFYGTVLLLSWRSISDYRRRVKVPGVGFPPIPFLSGWIAAYRFMRNPLQLMAEGINKYKPGFFRIATIQDEFVIVTDLGKVAEYIKAADDVLSMQDAANDQQQIPFTMGWGIGYRTYHTPIVRTNLTQSIKVHIKGMSEEMNRSFDELIGSPADWEAFPMYDIIAATVARVTNRVMVGPELCENKEFLKIAVDYAQAVVIAAELLRPFPDWLKHVVVRMLPVWSTRMKAGKILRPLLQRRLNGDFDDSEKPNDLMQWLVDAAPPIDRSIPKLVERIMALNVASIHTTTMTFTGALYQLAQEADKYMGELRAEVEKVTADRPLTKEKLNHLTRIDSFIRESGRMNNTGLLAMQRNAKKKFVFSDGTVVPPGAKIGTPTHFVQRDEEAYSHADQFDGFRFSRAREQEEGGAAKYQVVSTAPELHLFGHGKHACPGRFFAVTEMKLMFAELIQRYDMKLEDGTAPHKMLIATMAIPDTKLKVLLKARAS